MKSNQNTAISLEELLKVISPDPSGRQLPPVETWAPERSTDINMEIRADGSWWHEGGEIRRDRLVRLFSTILRRDEDGSYWLVTPYEKVVVHVEDVPFVAIRADTVSQDGENAMAFTTNVGDTVVAGPDHPIRVDTDPETGEPSPYVHVRGRLEAKLSRAVFYELGAMAEAG
ncbi:MAG: DUF1285 domain-containing protein, partial [Henriciella sp.]|uniref:DUF1285 domain-containing protein n=1 Tax=Henriciella sp. TaxID=1968823 RepID=UPI003C74629D